MISTAYIICCNDSIVACVLDNKAEAIKKKNILAKKDYLAKRIQKDYAEYCNIYFWHIHETDAE